MHFGEPIFTTCFINGFQSAYAALKKLKFVVAKLENIVGKGENASY